MFERHIETADSLDTLAHRAARRFYEAAERAIADPLRGRFLVALSGGSTPRALHQALVAHYRDLIPWERVQVFWSDERCVPPDDPDSNYRMARETLLEHVPLPAENIHRMPGERGDYDAAAADYEAEMRQVFGVPPDVLLRFDLILLGMGPDGHTASLFPGTAALHEASRLVVANQGQKPPPQRLTFTYPLLNSARQVMFLVAGADKAEALRDVLSGQATIDERPSVGVRPADGEVIWMVDREAMRLADQEGITS
ncbi:MAG TPA: 6-phosphogluconolactonase [Ktedonobacterales bacterium]|jgi:6-phosphogluconolactonase